MEKTIKELSQHFKLRDLGPTTQLLGIKIDRNWKKHSITISQYQYCLDILERFGMADCKPISTPRRCWGELLKMRDVFSQGGVLVIWTWLHTWYMSKVTLDQP